MTLNHDPHVGQVGDPPAVVLRRALRAHWLLIALVAFAAVAVAALAIDRRTPQYQATAQVLITPLPQYDMTFLGLDIIRDSGDPTRTAQTAAAVVESSPAPARVARELGGGWSARSVAGAVTVEPQGESNVLGVTAVAQDAGSAARLANTFARETIEARFETLEDDLTRRIDQLRERRGRLPDDDYEGQRNLVNQIDSLQAILDARKDPSLTLSQAATPPPSPTGAAPWLLLVIAGLAGAAVGILGAVAIEFLNRRARDEGEVLRAYPIPVLARVPPVRGRQRRRAAITPLGLPPAAREAFRMLRTQLEQRGDPPRTIMIASASSGDGKTTAAASLATSLAEAGHAVIAIDADVRNPQLARVLQVTPAGGLSSLTSADRLDDLLVDVPGTPRLRLLPATEGDAALLETLIRRLPEIVATARAGADFVVLDTAPLGDVSDALHLVGHVDDIVLVARPGNTERQKLETVRDVLERADARPVGLLLTGQAAGSPSAYYTYGAPAVRERSTA